ncbi:recombination protein O N-terminal domain-containing protein [Patescibacteria group bacterium]|nr:recombination protein O N-terminal domain-containing protein [Patescibacteria group bacterium]MDE2021504.1 recombination protein O N-terminal domain-containing protein [Patescibacteria group bacterium]MDE2173096.1 recombination protein O N-terminal domain-containing protein [Patescibacteria group bacterium]
MRHKYETRGIVVARTPSGEANAFITFITPGFGLVRARAQGLRRPGAKLAAALTTFAESELVLVHGKEYWRVTGAVPFENWFMRMQRSAPRKRASRVCGLLLRLVADEAHDTALFSVISGFFDALTVLPEDTHDAAEILAALRVLAALGLDTGEIPGELSSFTPAILATVVRERPAYITRINRGIVASGL